MELSFKSMRINPLLSAQQIRDPSLYAIPLTADLVLIVVLSPDEQKHKVVLSDRDGIYLPLGIHCDRASNQLLLTSEQCNTGVLYDISTTPT
jgi:hypothetical protein